MELESGSEVERAHKWRRVEMRMRPEVLRAWSRAWLQAWPRAKAVAMEVEANASLFAQTWAEVWTKAWVEAKGRAGAEGQGRAWTRAEAGALRELSFWRLLSFQRRKAEVEAEAEVVEEAEAEALALAGAWAWARGQARVRGEKVPSALLDSSAICRILTSLNRFGVARDLWHHSPETRDDYSCLVLFIAPITRLPFELLHQIFLIIIDDELSGPPVVLTLVCKHWHAIVTTIWASLNLGTRTPMDAVARKLERNQWLLDIVVDTDSDRGDFTPSDGAFEAIFAAIQARSRWRSLVVKSFPAQGDLPEDLINRRLQRCSNVTMNRFTTFKIKSACETSPLLDWLLHILGTMDTLELTTVEINSANVISFLASAYPSIFHSVKVLSLNTPGIPNPVDLLPHLHQLETFTASHIPFPIYHNHVHLPFVNTLRRLSLRAVSIQWMSGRTFQVLEHCTLIFPLRRHVPHTFTTTLPNCKHLTFQGYPLDILNGISAHKLTHLSVTSSGNQQLVQLSRQVLGESRLAPKILHISIEATNQTWVKALVYMSNLEELVIHNAQPSSLGAKVLQSLIVRPVHASNLGAKSTPGELGAPWCPSLRRLGLKYDRWLRSSERFGLIPVFVSIIRSRERSNYSLQSFSIWMTSNQKNPLELIEESRMSRVGLERLANRSEIRGEKSLGLETTGLVRIAPKPPMESSIPSFPTVTKFLVPPLPHGDRDASQDEGPSSGVQVEVRESPGDSFTDTLMILHPSTWFPTLIESAARFVRGIIMAVE